MTRKAPAFQFYADDFLAGTADLTAEERGILITLMALSWSKGYVRRDRAAIACAGASPESIDRVLAEKFQCDADGNYRNARLESIRAEQQARAEAGRRGGNARREAATADPPSKAEAKRKQTPSKTEATTTANELMSRHLDDAEFTAAFQDMVTQSRTNHFWPCDAVVQQSWLYELGRHPVADATEMLRFSISAGAKKPITNGDHKPRAKTNGNKRGPSQFERLGIKDSTELVESKAEANAKQTPSETEAKPNPPSPSPSPTPLRKKITLQSPYLDDLEFRDEFARMVKQSRINHQWACDTAEQQTWLDGLSNRSLAEATELLRSCIANKAKAPPTTGDQAIIPFRRLPDEQKSPDDRMARLGT